MTESGMRYFLFFLLLTLGITTPAHASFLNLNLATGLSCGGGGTLFASHGTDASACDAAGGFFSRFMCLFETTLGMVIAAFFCNLSQEWIEPFGVLLLIFMTALGIMFITGILEFTIKEISVAMFKIGLISTFAFNTDIALNIAFAFFINVTQNTVEMFSAVFTGSGSFDHVDASAANTVGISTTSGTGSSGGGCQFQGVGGTIMAAGLVLIAVAFFFFIPFVIGLFLLAIISALGFFARAAFGYLYSLVMLTFLIAAMPIFLGLALFQSTRDAFQSWLAQLFSNSIQIMIVFAFLAFAAQVDFGQLIDQISGLLVTKELTLSLPPITWIIGDNFGGYCTICAPNIVTPDPAYPSLQKIAGCKSPMHKLSWSEILGETEFLTFLLVNGAALYLLTSTMTEFMKMVPEIAKTLGGHDSSMMIGGVSRDYQGGPSSDAITAPGLTAATVGFERGVRNAWRNKAVSGNASTAGGFIKQNFLPTRIMGALKEVVNSAKYGASNLDRTQYRNLMRAGASAIANAKKKEVIREADMHKQQRELERLEEKQHETEMAMVDARAKLQQEKEKFVDSKQALENARLKNKLAKYALAGDDVSTYQAELQRREEKFQQVAKQTALARQEVRDYESNAVKSELQLQYERTQLSKAEAKLSTLSKKEQKEAKKAIEEQKERITKLEAEAFAKQQAYEEAKLRHSPRTLEYDQAVKALAEVHEQVRLASAAWDKNSGNLNHPRAVLEKLQQELQLTTQGLQDAEAATKLASQQVILRSQEQKALSVDLNITNTQTSKTELELSNAEAAYNDAILERQAIFESWNDPMRLRSAAAARTTNDQGEIMSRKDFEENKYGTGWWDEIWNPNNERQRFLGRTRESEYAHSKETWFQMLQFKD